KKEGYNEYIITGQELSSKKFDINLTPNSFDLYFPERASYKLGNTDTRGPVYVSKLKSGQYDINITSNKIIFRKTSNFLPAYVGVGTAFGISLCSTGALIGISEYFNYNANEAKKSGDLQNRYHYESVTKDIDNYAKIPSIVLSGVLFTGLISLIITDAILQYNDKKAKLEISDKDPSNQDGIFYDTALQYLGSGDIKKASDILQSITSLYPDSDLIPKVYYQLGQNYFILQDYDNALKNWEIFLRDYPIADYYDYVLKNMADIYYQKKELLTARNQLDKIIFTENILNRESISSLRAKLNYELYLQEKTDDYYIVTEKEYLKLIDDFTTSERIEVYFIQLLKLYNYKGDADKITKLKEKAIKLDGVSEKIKEIILSYFN
ncbi:MAG TPA: outer membrane protein assembly factor BamD, partial [Spirochaetota bacterium]|nr:outer membrane protein assembly factor BamD [Spirochaetota bacterium]